jgi:hypothetical protein
MTSDLPGETGALDPGVDQLFRTLTAPPTPAELAGEQHALAMFRANVRPPASHAPAGSRQSARRLGFPVRWSLRLAAAATLALGGGAAAAAYAAVLPAPVQHLAHNVLGFAGVPDTHQGSSAPNPGKSGHHTGLTTNPVTSPAQSTPTRASSTPAGSTSATPPASPTVSATPPAGPSLLSASAASAQITAGSEAVINGRLTRSGTGVAGVTVTLFERLAGHAGWRKAGTGTTTTDGNVAVAVPALVANAVFRLKIPGAPPSASVRVAVSPPIAAVLKVPPGGVQDALVISTQYARRGNVVVLQVQSPNGGWVHLRSKRLNASGKTTFVLSGTRLQNREVRVVLLATVRHGASVSNLVVVPPPS